MKATKASISVVLPVYNAASYLGSALQSVLDQSLQALEILVVDNGSTDGSLDLARSYSQHVRLIQEAERSPAAARNRGIREAQGGWIAFLDADDLWVSTKLLLQMNAFAEQPELDAVFGHLQQFISPELSESQRAYLLCPTQPEPGYHPGTLLVRKSFFDEVGLFNPQLQAGEFIDWFSRAREAGCHYRMIETVLYHRRLHLTNHGRRSKKSYDSDYLKILRGHLKRGGGGN